MIPKEEKHPLRLALNLFLVFLLLILVSFYAFPQTSEGFWPSFLSGLLRAWAFATLAAVFWVVAIAAAMKRAAKRTRPHSGDDLLGRSGNGRVFYSGAKLTERDIKPGGRPTLRLLRGQGPKDEK